MRSLYFPDTNNHLIRPSTQGLNRPGRQASQQTRHPTEQEDTLSSVGHKDAPASLPIPQRPLDPHSPHPSTPASCRGRGFAEPERANKNPSHSVWREGAAWVGGSVVGQSAGDFIHRSWPCPGWSLLPERLLGSYLLTRSPYWLLGDKPGSNWLMRVHPASLQPLPP